MSIQNTALSNSSLSISLEQPFDLSIVHSAGTNSTTMLCCHGFGGNSQKIIDRVRPYTTDNLIGFNFRDHDFTHETGDDNKTIMATPQEIMPLLYLLKKAVVEEQLSSISLYGHALGGANIIYALSFLNTDDQDLLLSKYGITSEVKMQIVNAIRKGKILLDVPFKSIEEVIALRGPNETLLMYQKRAASHNMSSPIETLKKLTGLDLKFVVFFDTNNEAMSNRDDSQFFKNLMDANSIGTNILINDDNGGHDTDHPTLWKIYSGLDI